MKNYLAMTDAELEKNELRRYKCPACTKDVGFELRYCPEHWQLEAAQGMTEYFQKQPFGNIGHTDNKP